MSENTFIEDSSFNIKLNLMLKDEGVGLKDTFDIVISKYDVISTYQSNEVKRISVPLTGNYLLRIAHSPVDRLQRQLAE